MSQPSAVASASFARSSPRCQLWTSLPRFPSGFCRLWSGPATKPSSEIDMWQVVRGIASSSAIDFLLLAFCNRLQHTATGTISHPLFLEPFQETEDGRRRSPLGVPDQPLAGGVRRQMEFADPPRHDVRRQAPLPRALAFGGGHLLQHPGRPPEKAPRGGDDNQGGRPEPQAGRGLPVLRAPGRTVDLKDHPAGGGPRLYQLERQVLAGVGEQPPALADEHREGEQGDLVDEVVLEQQPDQAEATDHLQLAPGLAFSSLTAATTSPERTIVSAHRGSVSVVDATYLGRELSASPFK